MPEHITRYTRFRLATITSELSIIFSTPFALIDLAKVAARRNTPPEVRNFAQGRPQNQFLVSAVETLAPPGKQVAQEQISERIEQWDQFPSSQGRRVIMSYIELQYIHAESDGLKVTKL